MKTDPKLEIYPSEKYKRNRAIYKDKKQGLSYMDLSLKYEISFQRVVQIVRREKEREEKKRLLQKVRLMERKEKI